MKVSIHNSNLPEFRSGFARRHTLVGAMPPSSNMQRLYKAWREGALKEIPEDAPTAFVFAAFVAYMNFLKPVRGALTKFKVAIPNDEVAELRSDLRSLRPANQDAFVVKWGSIEAQRQRLAEWDANAAGSDPSERSSDALFVPDYPRLKALQAFLSTAKMKKGEARAGAWPPGERLIAPIAFVTYREAGTALFRDTAVFKLYKSTALQKVSSPVDFERKIILMDEVHNLLDREGRLGHTEQPNERRGLSSSDRM